MTTILATWEQPGKIAIETAARSLKEGSDLRTVLEQGLAACELDPALLAIGLGALPNSDGEVELDASMMDGKDLSAGAVCGVRGIVPVISVARRVMERTPHVMIAGDQARRFAISQGFRPQNLMTAENIRRYDEWKLSPAAVEREYVHALDISKPLPTSLTLKIRDTSGDSATRTLTLLASNARRANQFSLR